MDNLSGSPQIHGSTNPGLSKLGLAGVCLVWSSTEHEFWEQPCEELFLMSSTKMEISSTEYSVVCIC